MTIKPAEHQTLHYRDDKEDISHYTTKNNSY